MSTRMGFWVPRVFIAFASATVLVAVADLAVMWRGGVRPGMVGSAYLGSLGAVGGLAVGIVAALLTLLGLLFGRGARLRIRSPGLLAVGLVLGAAFVWQNRLTFSGAGIREHPWRWAIAGGGWAGGCLLILVGLLAGTTILRAAARRGAVLRWTLAALFAAAAAGLYHVDATYLVGLYPQLHQQLALGVAIATGAALLAVLARPSAARPATLMLVAVLALAGSSALLRRSPAIHRERTAIALHATNVRQWMQLPEIAMERVAPLAEPDAGDSSAVSDRIAAEIELARSLDGELDRLMPGRRDLNLVVVSLDTLRPDHTSFEGYGRKTTPRLDELAKRGIWFERCYTSYPTSAWAYSSFFTGRHPSATPMAQAHDGPEDRPIPPDLPLAGLLKKAGTTTAAESAFNRATLARRDVFGHLRDGFARFNVDDPLSARDGNEVTAATLRLLPRLAQGRFFLWVHYLEPHEPYKKHAAHDFGDAPRDRYDSEIAAVDHELGRLVDAIDAAGLTEKTVFLVMSDHGEEFGEHHSRYHNTNLYEPQSRVPVVLVVPGLSRRAVTSTTSLVDFLPTLTHLFDVEDPHVRQGVDLWPRILGRSTFDGLAYAEFRGHSQLIGGGREMVVLGTNKMIRGTASRTEEVYDVVEDPGEKTNLLGRDEDRDRTLRALLAGTRRETLALAGGRIVPRESEETPERELSRRLTELAEPGDDRSKRIKRLYLDLTHGIAGINPRFEETLRGPARERVVAFFEKTWDVSDPAVAYAALHFAGRFGDRELLPVLTHSGDTSDKLLALTIFGTRGLLGDETCRPELEALVATPGVPNKHVLATGLLRLGRPTDERHLIAVLLARTPWDATQILRILGERRDERLVFLADEMLAHPHWQYAPLRLALVEALAGFTVTPLRNRLLARLAQDYEPSVARAARSVLERDLPAVADRERLLRAGGLEAEGDGAIVHRRFPSAIDYYEQAIRAYASPPGSLLLRLARLQQCFGDAARARALLEDAVAHGVPHARGRLDHLVPRQDLEQREIVFEIEKLEADRRVFRDMFYEVEARVRNTGTTPWPGGRVGIETSYRVVLIDKNDEEVSLTSAWDVGIGAADVGVGEGVDLTFHMRVPKVPGDYRIALRSVYLPPGGRVRLSKPVDSGSIFRVTLRLF